MTPAAPAPSSQSIAWSEEDLRADPHRAPDKAKRVQHMFSAIASRYDLNNRLHSFGRDQAWRREAVRLSELRLTDEVLDVACGTGDLAAAFAHAGAKRVVGLDFTPEMLDIARTKLARNPSAGRAVEFVLGDAMALPFADGSFDVVSIAWGIRNVVEPRRAIAEFHRVLRPGGRAVILEFSQPGNPMLRWLNRLYTARIMPITASWIARDRSGAYRYLPRSVEQFLSAHELGEAMASAGFQDVSLHPLTFGVCTIIRGRRAG